MLHLWCRSTYIAASLIQYLSHHPILNELNVVCCFNSRPKGFVHPQGVCLLFDEKREPGNSPADLCDIVISICAAKSI